MRVNTEEGRRVGVRVGPIISLGVGALLGSESRYCPGNRNFNSWRRLMATVRAAHRGHCAHATFAQLPNANDQGTLFDLVQTVEASV